MINDVKQLKSEVDILFGSINFNGKNGNVKQNMKLDPKLSYSDGKLKKTSGVSVGGDSFSAEVVAMQLIQNGVPLVSINDGGLEMIKNMQISFLNHYASGSINFVNRTKDSGYGVSVGAGVDIAKLEGKVIKIKIPGTEDYISVKISGSVGTSIGFKFLNEEDWKKVSEIKASLGIGGSAGFELGNNDYLKDSIHDFDF